MGKRKGNSGGAGDLRKRAEERLQPLSEDIERLAKEDPLELIHELRVHHVELEMQNAELRESRQRVEEARERYSDLYDFAPVGYVVLDPKGLIIEANLTAALMLGIDRSQLIGKPFDRFVAPESTDDSFLHRRVVFDGDKVQDAVLWLAGRGGTKFAAHVHSRAVKDAEGKVTQCRSSIVNITAREEAEDEIHELARLPEDCPNPMLRADAEGEVLYANPAAGKLLGQMGWKEGQALPREFLKPLRQAFDRQDVLQFDMVSPSQRTFSFFISPDAAKADANIYGRDVTERKKAEDALRESEERYRRLVETASEGIWQVDSDFNTTYVNGRMAEMLGCTAEEMVGRNTREFMDPDETGDFERRVADRRRGISETYERRVRRKDGSLFWAFVSACPRHDSEGNISGSFGMFTDITARKEAEEERKRLMEQIEDKNKVLQSIVYVASHDLRSPLLNVYGFSGQLAEQCEILRQIISEAGDIGELREKAKQIVDKELPENLSFIKAGAEKMDMLIKGMLTISRLGTAQMDIVKLDMNALMDKVVKAAAFEAKEKGAQINVRPLPPCKGDPPQINQLFANIVSNAVKYLDPNRKGLIEVTGTTEGAMSVYSVCDNGIGIAPEHKEKVFEIFHRLNPQNGIAGEGLGLSIVLRIVDRHNGRVRVDSTPGQGSTLHVALPAG